MRGWLSGLPDIRQKLEFNVLSGYIRLNILADTPVDRVLNLLSDRIFGITLVDIKEYSTNV